MENIENYSLFGFNLGGGKRPPQNGAGGGAGGGFNEFLSGILGGTFLGLGLSQLLDENRLKDIFADLEKNRTLEQKLQNIKWRIDTGNETDIYGAILILFSEMEKFIGALSHKFLESYYCQEDFRTKVSYLESKKIITAFESDTLRNTIYPKRNKLSHGTPEKVSKDEILQCYDFISQFMKKYNSLVQ